MIHLEDETERIGINLFNMANCELKQESSQKLYSTGLNVIKPYLSELPLHQRIKYFVINYVDDP